MARKARKRRFREARELKRGFDDGLFAEGDRTLADLQDGQREPIADDGGSESDNAPRRERLPLESSDADVGQSVRETGSRRQESG